jgi:hypothetical protein
MHQYITGQMVRDAFREALTERGDDHVAPVFDSEGNECDRGRTDDVVGCKYAEPRDRAVPSCIAGYAFNKFGLLPVVTQGFEDVGVGTVMMGLTENGLADFDSDAYNLLTTAQNRQDSGKTWGDSTQDLI